MGIEETTEKGTTAANRENHCENKSSFFLTNTKIHVELNKYVKTFNVLQLTDWWQLECHAEKQPQSRVESCIASHTKKGQMRKRSKIRLWLHATSLLWKNSQATLKTLDIMRMMFSRRFFVYFFSLFLVFRLFSVLATDFFALQFSLFPFLPSVHSFVCLLLFFFRSFLSSCLCE